jgi:hypothetical protein
MRRSRIGLNTRTWFALVIVAGVMCALLFGGAGTMRYWQAWVYVSIFRGAFVLTTVYLMKNDPALLARRRRGGPIFEKEATQRIIMGFTSLGFMALLVVPPVERRFGWSAVPVAGVVLGDARVALGFLFILLVYRENTFTSDHDRSGGGQQVISTGPYAVVRHPGTRVDRSTCSAHRSGSARTGASSRLWRWRRSSRGGSSTRKES